MLVALRGFELAWNLWPLLSLLFLHFGMKMSILCLSHHHILETHNFLVSQIHSWQGFPQNESYLENLTHTRFR